MPDWNAIKSEYITGTISYRKIAEEWGVSFRTLSQRAKREGWKAARDNHRENVVSKAVQKVENRKISENANHLLKLRDAADNMSVIIEKVFNDTAQFYRHIITEGVGMGVSKVEERTFKKMDTKAIKDLTGAIKDLAVVMRNLYDLPTIQEKSAMDIAAERLKLDQSKAAAQQDDADSKIVVEFYNPGEAGLSE